MQPRTLQVKTMSSIAVTRVQQSRPPLVVWHIRQIVGKIGMAVTFLIHTEYIAVKHTEAKMTSIVTVVI